MNVQVEPLDTHEVRMRISLEADVVERLRREVARDLGKQLRIPGFRPGQAPMNQVIRAVGGEGAFMAEVANKAASDFYGKALDEAKIEPYGPGSIEDVKTEPVFTLVAKVPLEPVVNLNDYKSVRIPAPEIVVTDEEVQEQLENMREDNAIIELAERAARPGDLVEATITGKEGDLEVFRSSSRQGIVLDESRIGIPGLAAAIVGMSAGEQKDIQLSFGEDEKNDMLRGKTLDVHIEVERVSSRTLPDINDELAQAASSFGTLEELKGDLRTRMQDFKQRRADQDYAVSALDRFAEIADVKMPPAFIEDRLGDLLTDYREDTARDTGLPFEQWLKLQSKTEDDIRNELRPEAERRGKRGLVMRELGRIEGLDVGEDEILAEVEATASRYGARHNEVRKLLAKPDTRATVRNNILSNKVLARMVEIAKGQAS